MEKLKATNANAHIHGNLENGYNIAFPKKTRKLTILILKSLGCVYID
jgi:hypothetical protein